MMRYEEALKATGEIGEVEEIINSLYYVNGLPSARVDEIVIFESGETGQVLTLGQEKIEVLLLTGKGAKVGSKVARTGKILDVALGHELLGKTIDPLGNSLNESFVIANPEYRPIEVEPAPIISRAEIKEPLTTGVSVVDLIVPLGRGQRELVIGDKKTGKTAFLLQTAYYQVLQGSVCIYAAVGKKRIEIKRFQEYFKNKGISQNVVLVASSAADSSGLIFVTPYAAMTMAEYFRDQGKDVLVILDDLSTHANHYREIALIGKRFPGRSSYPGDIFYIHSRLLERAGKFPKGSISVLPVVDTTLGDLSGYIQTNVMSMTDGHIFFDTELANLGRHPSVNPFLSVTRVGFQAQTGFIRDLSRKLAAFLLNLDKLRQFLHFGAELSEETLGQLNMGDKIISFFNQPPEAVIPLNLSAFVISAIWGGAWKEVELAQAKEAMAKIVKAYLTDANYRAKVDAMYSKANFLEDLARSVRDNPEILNVK